MFQRFERTHTVFLNEAISNFYKFQSKSDPVYFEKYQTLIQTSSRYANTFSRILKIIHEEGQSKVIIVMGDVFLESNPDMNKIIAQRIFLLQWHPLVKKLIQIAQDEDEKINEYIVELEKFKSITDLVLKKEKSVKILQIESFLLSNATSFAGALAELSEFAVNLVVISLISLFIIILFLGIIVIYFLSKKIRVQIQTYSDKFEELASGEGDLTIKIESNKEDEMKNLAIAFNTFLDKLNVIIKQVKQSSLVLNKTTDTIVVYSNSVSQSSKLDASSVKNISAELDELSQSIQSVFNESEQQNNDMNQMLNNLENLSEMFNRMVEQIEISLKQGQKISENAKDGEKKLNLMNRSITTIADSSQKINDTIKIITSISEKINLLSLNAAIEAARAGESGKGFVVVADEISKLADQTAGSIKMIASLVNENKAEIQMGITNVTSASEVIKRIINDVVSIQKKMELIAEIVTNQKSTNVHVKETVTHLLKRTQNLKNAIIEEKTVVKSIENSMNELSSNSQKNANSAEILLSQTTALQKVSNEIIQSVSIFKT